MVFQIITSSLDHDSVGWTQRKEKKEKVDDNVTVYRIHYMWAKRALVPFILPINS